MRTLSLAKAACIVFVFCVAAAIVASAQTFNTLVNFDGTDGASPKSESLVQGFDRNLYGTTQLGGAYGQGTIFKITAEGTLTTLHSFNVTDGQFPEGLVQGTDGNFYGITVQGGASGEGTIFKITPGGTLTTVRSFDLTDGGYLRGGLAQGTDGNFYGITGNDAANCLTVVGCGTVFKITPEGTLTTLYHFCSQKNCADGASPAAPLVEGSDGNFYGTTKYGGAFCITSRGCGTVFKITPSGTLTRLHSFNFTDGANPFVRLVQATNGNFYGTTSSYGAYGFGTVFKITPCGTLTTLHSFDFTDGANPASGLVQGNDGNFYGTTYLGGAYCSIFNPQVCGTVFKITPSGTLTTLHSFDFTDGANPEGELVQATNGDFYGTTPVGGSYGSACPSDACGTVFSLSVGLGPFVTFVVDFGKVGQTAEVLGQALTGATAVSFNGTPATFIVVSDTYMTATIPAGATTGFVTVTTPGGALKSNQNFHVLPQIFSFSPTSGPVGTSVVITGESFTQAAAVTLAHKYPMNFTVNSDTQITATIPASGATGEISLRSPGGAAHTSAKFIVTP